VAPVNSVGVRSLITAPCVCDVIKGDTIDFQLTRILGAVMEMFLEVPHSRLGPL
jgi:hypothetical protein